MSPPNTSCRSDTATTTSCKRQLVTRYRNRVNGKTLPLAAKIGTLLQFQNLEKNMTQTSHNCSTSTRRTYTPSPHGIGADTFEPRKIASVREHDEPKKFGLH